MADAPITVAALGLGVNSVAMTIEMVRRGEPIHLILNADPGSEFPWTYEYRGIFNEWLLAHDMPEITVVQKVDRHGNIITLEQHCLKFKMLPSIAYGFKQCSIKFKIGPQDKYVNNWRPAREAWKRGERVIRLIGYDADEPQRAKIFEDKKYIYRHPLIEWGMGRAECVKVIEKAGLPVPGKSSCFFCPSMKKREIFELKRRCPDLLQRALNIEFTAMGTLRVVEGLGRHWAWKDLIEAEENQIKMFCDAVDTTCNCYDGWS